MSKGERTKARVLEAAAEVMSETGFAGASTREIATRSGVSEGTLFKYFPTKRSLLNAVLNPLFEHVVAPAATASLIAELKKTPTSLGDFLERVYDDRARLVRRGSPALRVALQEIGVNRELRMRVLESFQERVAPEMVAALKRMRRRGLIRKDITPAQAARMIVTSIAGDMFLQHVAAPEAGWDADDERRATLSMLERALQV